MAKIIMCKNCKRKYLIKENGLYADGIKHTEKVFCPNCKEEIYSDEIKGWFFVTSKTEKKKEALVTHPMP